MTAFTAFCGIAFNASDAESTQHHEAMRSRSGASFRGSGKTLEAQVFSPSKSTYYRMFFL